MPRIEGETYFNNDRPGYDELKDWTPAYYQKIKETDANLQFAGKTIDEMANALEEWCRNMFIDTMSEEMIGRMEAFYYINNSDRTLDERRSLLKSAQIGSGKFDVDRIKRIIKVYAGVECEIVFIHELNIILHSGTKAITLSDFIEIIGKQIPAHISWHVIIDIVTNGINVGRSICYWKYDFDRCGTNPDIATVGDAIETDFQFDGNGSAFVYEQEKTGMAVSGTTPRIEIVGTAINTSIEAVIDTNQYIYDHQKAGTIVAGTYPDIEIVSSSVISEINILSDAESHIFEFKKCSKNDREEED